MTPCAARNMIPVSAVENMTFWPELRSAREVAILTDAFSYVRKCVSYRSTSYRSLLKFYPREVISRYVTYAKNGVCGPLQLRS